MTFQASFNNFHRRSLDVGQCIWPSASSYPVKVVRDYSDCKDRIIFFNILSFSLRCKNFPQCFEKCSELSSLNNFSNVPLRSVFQISLILTISYSIRWNNDFMQQFAQKVPLIEEHSGWKLFATNITNKIFLWLFLFIYKK